MLDQARWADETLLYAVSPAADNVNRWRFDANLWDLSLLPAEAAHRPAGFEMHPQPVWRMTGHRGLRSTSELA